MTIPRDHRSNGPSLGCERGHSDLGNRERQRMLEVLVGVKSSLTRSTPCRYVMIIHSPACMRHPRFNVEFSIRNSPFWPPCHHIYTLQSQVAASLPRPHIRPRKLPRVCLSLDRVSASAISHVRRLVSAVTYPPQLPAKRPCQPRHPLDRRSGPPGRSSSQRPRSIPATHVLKVPQDCSIRGFD